MEQTLEIRVSTCDGGSVERQKSKLFFVFSFLRNGRHRQSQTVCGEADILCFGLKRGGSVGVGNWRRTDEINTHTKMGLAWSNAALNDRRGEGRRTN